MFGILMDAQVVSIADSGKAVVTEMITVLVGGSAYLAVAALGQWWMIDPVVVHWRLVMYVEVVATLVNCSSGDVPNAK